MYKIYFFLILAMLLFFIGACSVMNKSVNKQNPLLGTWEYVDCSLKNTCINGTLVVNNPPSYQA